MRVFSDVVDNVFSSFRLIALLIFGAVMLIGLFMTIGATVIAPKAVEMAADRAESLGEKAIAAEERIKRDRDLAREGWGYSESSSSSRARVNGDKDAGGWGED